MNRPRGHPASTLFPVTAADVALTTDDWYTPRWVFDAAGLVFDMDVCAPVAPEFRTCPARRFLTVVEDGLTAPWEGLVWMNPPYSNPEPWVRRWASHPDGLALVPAVASPWRGSLLLAADGVALLSVTNKQVQPGFGRPDGSRIGLPFALILAARGEAATNALGAVAMSDPHSGGAYHVRPQEK